MPHAGHEKSVLKKSINESYRSIQIGVPLVRTTSTGVLEYNQRSFHLSSWQPSILEVEYRLKTVENPQTDSAAFRSITPETLYELISSKTQEEFNREFILLDCRYHYEYNGGHIKYSTNLFDPNKLESLFYPDDEDEFNEICSRVPIFYCEYSQARGPNMAHALRRIDRRRNEDFYPIVDYPEMYLLDGGYKNFFSQFQDKDICVPDKYVPMTHKKYRHILKKFTFHKYRSQGTIARNNNGSDAEINFKSRKRSFCDIPPINSTPLMNTPILKSNPIMTSTPIRTTQNRSGIKLFSEIELSLL